jgi:hypothetical protein
MNGIRATRGWTAALCILAALPAAGQGIKEDPTRRLPGSVAAAKAGRSPGAEAVPSKDHNCQNPEIRPISCGQTVNGSLTQSDCQLDEDQSYLEFWEFQGVDGQDVTVTMNSSQVDSYLLLLDPEPFVVDENDDGGGGSNARLTYELDVNGTWTIAANTRLGNELGNYTLTLACSGANPNLPSAPSNLQAQAASNSEIDLTWQDNSNNETGFRIEFRTQGGSFQELGSVSANSTSATAFDLQAGTAYTFRVQSVNANGASGFSNQATATTTGGGGGDGFLTSPEVPGFRFRVTIFPVGGSPITGRRENDCIPETLCVSGAIPGRSEVFLRVIGPRPNGYLWPTIVRFTPSRVVVEVQQISTSFTKTYELPAVPQGSDELDGLQDRTGFLP